MTTAERINQLLRSRPVPLHHRVHVGEELEIQLPRVPLVADTQFVELSTAVEERGAIELTGDSGSLDGTMLPRSVRARAIQPGRSVVSVVALDAVSRRPMTGVEPVEIVIDVAE